MIFYLVKVCVEWVRVFTSHHPTIHWFTLSCRSVLAQTQWSLGQTLILQTSRSH